MEIGVQRSCGSHTLKHILHPASSSCHSISHSYTLGISLQKESVHSLSPAPLCQLLTLSSGRSLLSLSPQLFVRSRRTARSWNPRPRPDAPLVLLSGSIWPVHPLSFLNVFYALLPGCHDPLPATHTLPSPQPLPAPFLIILTLDFQAPECMESSLLLSSFPPPTPCVLLCSYGVHWQLPDFIPRADHSP